MRIAIVQFWVQPGSAF